MRWPFSRQRALPAFDSMENRARLLSGGDAAALKVDLHVHTGEDPEDGVGYSSYELLDLASGLGFDVISITNHNVITYSEALASYARKRGILLIPGVEKTLCGKHVLIVNAKKEDLSAKSFEELFSKRRGDRLVVAPHPYFPSINSLRGRLISHLDLFSGIEYSHYYTNSVNFNRKAVELSCERSLPLIGTSDAHFPSQLGMTYSMVQASRDIESVIAAVRSGRVKVVTNPLSLSQAFKIRLAMSLI